MVGGAAKIVNDWVAENRFVRHVLLLASGTAFSQALLALAAPLLTRLYSPTDFGILAVYSSILSLLLIVVSLHYELAIPLAESDEKARALFVLGCLLVLATSLLAGGSVWGFEKKLISWTKTEPLGPYLWTLPLGMFGAGIYQLGNYWAVRKKEFGTITRTKLQQNLGIIAVQAGTGFVGLGPVGLLLGDVTGRIVGALALIRAIDWRMMLSLRKKDLASVARAYADFPLILLWAVLCNTAATQAPFLLLPHYFGVEAVGYFFLSYQVLALPSAVLAGALSQVFFAEIARNCSHLLRRQATMSVASLAASVTIPVYLGLAIVGPRAFAHIFGMQWTEAGEYARWLALVMPLRLIASTLSQLQTVTRRFWESLLFTILNLAGILVAVGVGVAWGSVRAFVISMAAIMLPLTLSYLWRYARLANIGLPELFQSAIIPALLLNAPMIAALLLSVLYLPSFWPMYVWLILSVPVISISLWQARALLALNEKGADEMEAEKIE